MQLREMENRRAEVQRQLQNPDDPMFATDWSMDEFSPQDMRIQALTAKLTYLLTKYTELHPEVVDPTRRELEAEKQAARRGGLGGGPRGDPRTGGKPCLPADAGDALGGRCRGGRIRVRVQEHEQRVKELEDKVNNIPQIEAELAQLNRDYDVVRSQHATLLQRRESARLSEDVEQTAGDVVFRVIDPPFVPNRPGEPKEAVAEFRGAADRDRRCTGCGIASVDAATGDRGSPLAEDGLPVLGQHRHTQMHGARTTQGAFVTHGAWVASVALLVVFADRDVAPADAVDMNQDGAQITDARPAGSA